MGSEESNPRSSTKFHFFMELPVELRLKIYRLAIRDSFSEFGVPRLFFEQHREKDRTEFFLDLFPSHPIIAQWKTEDEVSKGELTQDDVEKQLKGAALLPIQSRLSLYAHAICRLAFPLELARRQSGPPLFMSARGVAPNLKEIIAVIFPIKMTNGIIDMDETEMIPHQERAVLESSCDRGQWKLVERFCYEATLHINLDKTPTLTFMVDKSFIKSKTRDEPSQE
ncbi:hypothetical protein GLAREA_06685 [Glarea lozoyensis ATCC 20868]|uniref:Uncharacterized protein n=1 Tax=Glarea lozoyensis (strain ATCC 20868 / MF5171) TaxID=1116229 RepID=S3D5C3_GLAL2|nr:uncharacterized protein GLAREA_06685 [Glarea lozoyensis ATCC 20868]EPE33672.1 hypothetical protein GLAREA_06685 [Glarea lozoyensis ATCC 20868]